MKQGCRYNSTSPGYCTVSYRLTIRIKKTVTYSTYFKHFQWEVHLLIPKGSQNSQKLKSNKISKLLVAKCYKTNTES